ncbi:MAG: PIN domain-containing protein [Deltaproteobacteria bacterium]|nr:PIN domain-containing protein [Deltaproteobacteria bacterium]
MNAVFDTNILIDYLNGDRRSKEEFERYDELHISIITQIEILVGARSGREEIELAGFLSRFKTHAIDGEMAKETVRVRRKFKMRIPDAIIKATAERLGYVLVTRNTKDFSRKWPDIRVPY